MERRRLNAHLYAYLRLVLFLLLLLRITTLILPEMCPALYLLWRKDVLCSLQEKLRSLLWRKKKSFNCLRISFGRYAEIYCYSIYLSFIRRRAYNGYMYICIVCLFSALIVFIVIFSSHFLLLLFMMISLLLRLLPSFFLLLSLLSLFSLLLRLLFLISLLLFLLPSTSLMLSLAILLSWLPLTSLFFFFSFSVVFSLFFLDSLFSSFVSSILVYKKCSTRNFQWNKRNANNNKEIKQHL